MKPKTPNKKPLQPEVKSDKKQKVLQDEVKKEKQSKLLYLILILVVTAITFSNSLKNDFVNLDDGEYVTGNKLIQDLSFTGIKNIFTTYVAGNYHPLTVLVNAVLFHISGLNPTVYHFFSLLLHLLNIVLVFKLIGSISGKKEIAGIVALLFAIHPLHAETVYWVSDIKDLLYTFFFLSSLIYYIRYIKTQHYKFLFLTTGLFIASLFSKPSAVTLPLILFLLDYYYDRKISLKTILEKIPLLALSFGFGVVNIFAQKTIKVFDIPVAYNLTERIFIPFYTLFYYIYSLFFPFGLSVIHPYPEKVNNLLPWVYYASVPALLILFGLVAWLAIKKEKCHKPLIFGILFFLITISLLLQFAPIGHSVVSERYTYLPYIGLFFVIASIYASIQNSTVKRNAGIAIGLISISFIAMSFQRGEAWANTIALSSDNINKYPDYAISYCLRAGEESKLGDLKSSLADYSKAATLDTGFAEIYYNRAIVKKSLNDLTGAIADYTKAIELKPKLLDAYNNRAEVKRTLNDLNGAIADYNKAIELDKKHPETYNNRGEAKRLLQQYPEALVDYNKAIELDSTLVAAYNNRGIVKFYLSDLDGSIRDFTTSIRLKPDATPYNNRGNVKLKTNDQKGAAEDFSAAINLNPNYAEAYLSRGNTRFNLNDRTGACNDWRKAVSLGVNAANQNINLYCQ